MNSSKISLPSPFCITIYFWFSQISLIISCFVSFFHFYIILSQSKSLKNYKWFILSTSFWSFAFEAILGFFKPLLLLPAFAGFPLSVIRENGSYQISATATYLGFIFGINYIASLFVTIFSRYLTVFPSVLTNWISRKFLIRIAVFFMFILYALLIFAAIPALSTDIKTVIIEAKLYDIFFETFNEPSFLFFPMKNIKTIIGLEIALCFLIMMFVVGIAVIIIFTHLVKKHSTLSVSKIQRSMIISSVVQILLTLLFLILPIIILIFVFLLKIPHTSVLACICIAIISLHSILESIASLYFVIPYRNFIQKQFFKRHMFKNKRRMFQKSFPSYNPSILFIRSSQK